jgi:hypothetical protein
MTVPIAVIVLPYGLNILVKLSSLALNRRLVLRALDNLVSIPTPTSGTGSPFVLDTNQQTVIASHVSRATLTSSTILTFLGSIVATIVFSYNHSTVWWVSWMLPLLLFSFIPLLWWVLPSHIFTFRRKWLGLAGSTRLVIVFCLYDFLLGTASVVTAWKAGETCH